MMTTTARMLAFDSLQAIINDKAYSNLEINNILSEQDLYTNNTIEAEDIDSIIESLQEGNTEEGEVQFIVAQKNSKLVSISLNQNDNNIQLTKNNQEDSVNYSISVNFKFDTGLSRIGTIGGTVYFSANFKCFATSNTCLKCKICS